jgi:aspartate carbamoyltransferase catalytic subunit
MPPKIIKFLKEKNIKYLFPNVYRYTTERFTDLSEYERVKNDFILDLEILDGNTQITIMHPLPRVNEVKEEIDKLKNAAFFRQAEN